MKYNFFLFFLFAYLIILTNCTKPTEQKEIKKKEKKKIVINKEKKILKKKTILIINEKEYKEDDFKKFLDLHSKSFNIENKNKMYSYFFNKYIIQRMILYKIEDDNFETNRDQLMADIRSKFNSIKDEEIEELLNTEKINTYLNYKLYNNVKIKEQDVWDYYNNNRHEFTRRAQVHLFEIKLKDKEKANEIRAILNTNPHRFSEIAKTESKSKVAKENGSLGFIDPDSLPESFKKFIKSVPINKITPVVEFLYGKINGNNVYTYHIFKVVKRKRAAKLLFFKNVKDKIKNSLVQKAKDKLYKDFIANLSNSLKTKVIIKNLFFKYEKK